MTYNGSDKHKIALFTGKQDKLTAGSNITLTPLSDGTVEISATGGGGGGGDVADVQMNGVSILDSDNVANIEDFDGASVSADGTAGLVPQPLSAERNKYLRGDGTWDFIQNSGFIYSDTEREVGVWVNAKPLYQKTITLPNNVSVASNTWVTIYTDSFIGGIEQIVSAIYHNMANSGVYNANYIKPNGNNLQYLFPGSGSLSINSGAKFTIWYTKTTDTAGSGTWTPSGNYSHHYSTVEQIIGTWVDNNTLYEIAVPTGGSVPTGGILIDRIAKTGYDILQYTKSS